MSVCSICSKPAKAHDLCGKHYMRMRRHGDPEFVNRPADWGMRSNALERASAAKDRIYERLFAEQNGLCAICGMPETCTAQNGHEFRLAIDHCHESGQVRALLCFACNAAIGMMMENPERMRKAAEYLEKHVEKQHPEWISDELKPAPMRKCSVDGCNRIHESYGYCRKHHRRIIAGRTMEPHVCKQCGNPMPDSARIIAKFCSASCKMKWHRAQGCYQSDVLAQASVRKCSVDGCDRPHQAQGMCRRHYMQKWHAEHPGASHKSQDAA